jgi:uncharacterized protein (DUF2141 family)
MITTKKLSRASKRLALAVLSVTAALLAPSPGRTDEGRTITVNVSSFRNEKGALGCRLYAGPNGFPKKLTHVAQQTVAIHGTSATCRFTGIAPGIYAIAVVHDENANGRVDTNFVGVPTEGYGVSNNRTYALSWPKWEQSKFQVTPATDVVLAVTLRY